MDFIIAQSEAAGYRGIEKAQVMQSFYAVQATG